jgi:transposase
VVPPVEALPPAAVPDDPMPSLSAADRPTNGTIEVELPSGVRLRLTGPVDEVALRRVLSALS